MSTCADHTYGPSDYWGWHEWAEEKAKTHEQSACGECGRYMIWTPTDLTVTAPTKRPAERADNGSHSASGGGS